jgi:LPXTG-motif cell wall-anchored protein
MRSVFRLGRILAATAAVAAGGLSIPSIAVAGETIAPQIAVSPSTVEVGETFTVDGAGWFGCSEDITVVIDNEAGTATEAVGTVPAADVVDGSWSLQSPAPPIPGTYTVRAYFAVECPGDATDELIVVAAATTTTTTTTTTTPTTTTLAPTTLAPTTLAPTTLAPTTLAPTTLAPTTTQQIIAPVSTLPETGTPESRTAAMAAGILALGAALIWMARRPRST